MVKYLKITMIVVGIHDSLVGEYLILSIAVPINIVLKKLTP